jgi:hypothetical protein
MNLERGRPVGCAFFYAGQCQTDLAHRVEVNCALCHGRVRLSARTGTFSRQAIATSRTPLWLASGWGCWGRHDTEVAKTLTGAVGYGKPRTSFGNLLLRNGFLGTRRYGAMAKTADRNREQDTSRSCLRQLCAEILSHLVLYRRPLRTALQRI